MANDLDEYVTMRELGEVLGVSSHVVGRKLKELGLRDREGHPTDKAKNSGITKSMVVDERYVLDLWHEDQTIQLLRPTIDSG